MKIYFAAILALQGATANRVGRPGKLRGGLQNGVKNNGGIRGVPGTRTQQNKFNRMSNPDKYADHNSVEYISMKEQGMIDQNVMDMDHNSVEYVNFKAGKRGDQANHRPPVPLNPDEYVDHNSVEYVSMKEQVMVDQNVKAMKDHYSEEYVNAKVNSVHPAPRDDPYDPNHPVFTDHNSEEYIKAKASSIHPAPRDDPYDPNHPVFTDNKMDEFEFHQDIERLQHDISVFENELAKIEAKHDEKVEGIFSN